MRIERVNRGSMTALVRGHPASKDGPDAVGNVAHDVDRPEGACRNLDCCMTYSLVMLSVSYRVEERLR